MKSRCRNILKKSNYHEKFNETSAQGLLCNPATKQKQFSGDCNFRTGNGVFSKHDFGILLAKFTLNYEFNKSSWILDFCLLNFKSLAMKTKLFYCIDYQHRPVTLWEELLALTYSMESLVHIFATAVKCSDFAGRSYRFVHLHENWLCFFSS